MVTEVKSEKEVSEFYNDFFLNLGGKRVYRNLRHYKIIDAIFSEGLKRSSKVLEIGCGSGAISFLLAKYLSKGSFVGMDISDAWIAKLNQQFENKVNVKFVNSDIANFKVDLKFDFILLADVLEHIPLKLHEETFEKLAENCDDGGKLIINIPTKEFINWQGIYEPNLLQIIDQPLSTSHVCALANKNGFTCLYSKKHQLFQQSVDYELFVFEKMTAASSFQKRNKLVIIVQKLILRIKVNYKLLFS